MFRLQRRRDDGNFLPLFLTVYATLNNQFFSSPFNSFDQLPMITSHFDSNSLRADWKYQTIIGRLELGSDETKKKQFT